MGVLTKARVAMVAAEFFGAGLLTLTALAAVQSDLPIAFFMAAGLGLVYALVYVIFGGTSGAHANPAVSIGFWSVRKISSPKLLVYIAAQLAGGILAYRLFLTLSKTEVIDGFVWPGFGQGADFWLVLVAELIGAFVFTMAISAALSKKLDSTRFASVVGVALFAGVLLASFVPKQLETLSRGETRFHDGVINPVVAIGTQHYGWEYVIGPVTGAIIGMNTYAYLFSGGSAWKLQRNTVAAKAVVASRSVGSKSTRSTKKPAKKRTARKKK